MESDSESLRLVGEQGVRENSIVLDEGLMGERVTSHIDEATRADSHSNERAIVRLQANKGRFQLGDRLAEPYQVTNKRDA